GTGKTVTATDLGLSGADASNYSLSSTSATTAADITARMLHVTATADSKGYNGTTAAVAHLADDRVLGDVFSTSYTSATFSDKNVGAGKTVTVTGIAIGAGADAGNYELSNTSTTATANITARPLTVSATGVDKTYDGTTTATVTLSDNRVAGDVFTDSYTTASFAGKNVGTTTSG